ncbi:hypothetical protein VL20_1365 [Microcystis panniformis FACHB-1757]|uniref:Uncharacterized protein n=1 Tax=Microcystis panniformis FACHB-1757 TaxID=1638788 RepID=A0A0K1RXU0_9CHRO|nr:hypothetical protein VL20_1365 [Microcystis panniformis FACHB-1757]
MLTPPTFLITFVNVCAMETSSLVWFPRLYDCIFQKTGTACYK